MGVDDVGATIGLNVEGKAEGEEVGDDAVGTLVSVVDGAIDMA